MELSQLLPFALASFLMALMPGPDNLFVITESISKGTRNGLLIAFGLNSGVLVHTLVAATGLGLLLKESPLAFQIIQYAGAAYLLYLAYGAYREEALVLDENAVSASSERGIKLIGTGFLMNVLNPKVSLFFMAFLPQFVRTEAAWSPTYQLAVLGLVFMLVGWISFSGFALLAGKLRNLASGKRFGIYTKWLKVLVLVFLGLYLLLPN